MIGGSASKKITFILTEQDDFLLKPSRAFGLFAIAAGRIFLVFMDLTAVLLFGLLVASISNDELQTPIPLFSTWLLGLTSNLILLGTITSAVLVLRGFFAVMLVFMQTSLLSASQADFANQLIQKTIPDKNSWTDVDSPKLIQRVTDGARARFVQIPMAKINLAAESSLVLVLCFSFIIVDPFLGGTSVIYIALAAIIQNAVIRKEIVFHSKTFKERQVSITGEVGNLWANRHEISLVDQFGDGIWQTMGYSQNRFSRSMARLIFFRGLPRYYIEAVVIVGIAAILALGFSTDALSDKSAELGFLLAGFFRISTAISPIQVSLQNLTSAQEIASTDDKGGSSHEKNPRTIFSSGLDTKRPKSVIGEIRYGEKIAIAGGSGSGKTTILKQLAGFFPSEQISYEGFSFHNPLEKKNLFSYVTQDPGLYSGNLRFNLNPFEAKIRTGDMDRIIQAFGLRHLDEEGNLLFHGEPVCSGGELQRIAIARAVLQDSELLLLDEPTSNLDSSLAELVFAYLTEEYAGAVIAVSHDRENLIKFDRVIELS